MKFPALLFFIIFSAIGSLQAQYDEELKYKSEKLAGCHFYTHGGLLGGFTFKSSERKNAAKINSWYIDLVQVKHPQEVRYPGSNFIFGKKNYLFSFRPGFTKGYILFLPAKEEGVQLNVFFGGGISVGMVKPYYIKYNYSPNLGNPIIKEEAYDPVRHSNIGRIAGRGSFLTGLEDSKFIPGLHVKGGLTFYFGNVEKRLTGIEVGTVTEAFLASGNSFLIEPREVEILSSNQNRWLYSVIYLNLFYAWRK